MRLGWPVWSLEGRGSDKPVSLQCSLAPVTRPPPLLLEHPCEGRVQGVFYIVQVTVVHSRV